MTRNSIPPGWPANSDWTLRLESQFQSPKFTALMEFVNQERLAETIYPSAENVFTAFDLTPFADIKVVILGQDPYHGPGQAHGLSFSVQGDTRIPPSLKNIYRELHDDLSMTPPDHGDLTNWAKQGVFLLNTVLTVREGQANSHRKQGWEEFTDDVIRQLNQHPRSLVFILWGKPAEKKAELLDSDRHTIITSPHPSPLSARRGFFGSRPFSQANLALQKDGRSPVDWSIPS